MKYVFSLKGILNALMEKGYNKTDLEDLRFDSLVSMYSGINTRDMKSVITESGSDQIIVEMYECDKTEVMDILGIEEEYRNTEWSNDLVKQFNILVKYHDKNTIWLKDSFLLYSGNGEIIDYTNDLVVVKANA